MSWLKRFTARCDERLRMHARCRTGVAAGVLGMVALTLGGCASWRAGQGGGAAPSAPPVSHAASTPSSAANATGGGTTDPAASPRATGPVKLAAPRPVHNWAEVREQAARRLVAANPHLSYAGRTPDVLLAIPVMAVELHANGSVRRIEVMRSPRQARDTVQLAIQAIQNAAPFGDVSRLPKPWRFNETFLFNDDRKFKPMTLDRR